MAATKTKGARKPARSKPAKGKGKTARTKKR